MDSGDAREPRECLAGLYIHVPFCSSVCPYCDFAVTLAGEDRRAGWEEGLREEADLHRESSWRFDTVYLGGGTPSALDGERLASVVDSLRARFDIAAGARWFIELNPEDVTAEAVARWRDLGFTSVSVGVQSLDDDALRFLGRRHDAAAARAAVGRLLAAGFDTVSVDLIFGLPGQEGGAWGTELRAAAALGVHHVSCYQLTIHHGTVFGRRRDAGRLTESDDGVQADLYLQTHEILGEAGFEGYEVSNFARPGHRSAHNLKYWTGAPYLGLGPGAHSFDGGDHRWWNRRKLRLWRRDLQRGSRPLEGEERLNPEELALESVMLGLRTADGVDLRAVESRFGVAIEAVNVETLAGFEARGLIRRAGPVIAPTAAGMAVADGLTRAIEIGRRAG